ncbi:MAG: hypothetical protein ACOC3C_01240 [Candidatus Thorarchaeota archaeon]
MESINKDLSLIDEKLAKATGMKVKMSLPDVLLLQSDDGQVINIFSSGRILFRQYPSEQAVKDVMTLLFPVLSSSKTIS